MNKEQYFKTKEEYIAFETIKLIFNVEVTFLSENKDFSFTSIVELFEEDLIDAEIANLFGCHQMKSKSGKFCLGEKKDYSEYNFELFVIKTKSGEWESSEFYAIAMPFNDKDINRGFYVDQTGVIRYSDN